MEPAGVRAVNRQDEVATGSADGLAETAVRARGGDQAAFRRLIELTSGRLFRIAAHIAGDPDEADDVVQETFIRAWGRIGELRDPGAALGWLARIARNVARDRLRARRRRGERPGSARADSAADRRDAEPPAGPGSRPDEKLESAELHAAVRRAVGELSEKHRVVLLLREIDGMSYEEIAELLDLPVGTVESRLHRARTALTRRLERLRRAGEVP